MSYNNDRGYGFKTKMKIKETQKCHFLLLLYHNHDFEFMKLIDMEKKAPVRPANFEFRSVGYGKQDFHSILKAAEKAGTEWVVVEQDKPSMDLTPMECAEKSRAYLKSIGN